MEMSICTDVFGKIEFTEMLDKVKAYGINAIELTAGGWGGCFFIPSARDLIDHEDKFKAFKNEIDKRGLTISALNCSGNQLVNNAMGHAHSRTIHDTAVLAGKLGVKTLVMMSGLPEGAPGDVKRYMYLSRNSGSTRAASAKPGGAGPSSLLCLGSK